MGYKKPRFYFIACPNWVSDVNVGRSFNTTVTESVTGKEQRAGLINSPVQSIEYKVDAIQAKESFYILRVMHKYQHELLGVPQWPEYASLASEATSGQAILECDSLSNKEFEEWNEVIIIGDDWETYEVGTIVEIDGDEIRLADNLISTWPIYSEVYPILPMRIEKSLSGQFNTDYYSGWQLSFRESLEETTTSTSSSTTSSSSTTTSTTA